MRRAAAAAVVVGLAICAGGAAGCGDKKRQRRGGDAAPVELVDQPVLGGDAGVGGDDSDEREPNDSGDVASALPVGGGAVRGRIEPDADVDVYRIEVAQPAALAIAVTAVAGVDLVLEIHDPGGAVIARSDRGAANIAEGVPNLGAQPGRYLAVVRKKPAPAARPAKKNKRGKGAAAAAGSGSGSGAGSAATGPAPVYRISVGPAAVVTGATSEREPDDDRGTANDLIPNEPASGYLGWTGDTDVWKLSLEAIAANNELDIEISAIDGVALSLEVADGIGGPLLVRKVPRGLPLIVRGFVPVVPAGAPPYHYLSVRGDRSNPDVAYALKIVPGVPKDTDPEVEPNDAVDRPMPIPADRTTVNARWTPGDVDCFALPADAAARTVEVAIAPPDAADLSAELLIDGAVVGKSELKGLGVAEKLTAPVPAGATAVIRVRGSDASAEGRYAVTVRDLPAAP